MADIGKQMLDQYKPPELIIDCPRCKRRAVLEVASLKKKFGNQPLAVIARMAARASTSIHGPCALADDPFQLLCSARASAPDPVTWASILDAERGGWMAFLHCERHMAGLKRAEACREVTPLPVTVLKAIFGWDAKLWGLNQRMRCPHCGTPLVQIEWKIPAEAPDPGGSTEAEPAPILQLRPTRAMLGRRRFRVIESPPRKTK